MAIDYGSKRVGIAVTDPLRLIAGALTVVHSKDVFDFLENYLKGETVDAIVVGEPRTMANNQSDSSRFIDPFVKALKRKFPGVRIDRFDERFTSVMAKQAMIDSGLGKKARQEKKTVDQISAIIILQDYMRSIDTQNRRG